MPKTKRKVSVSKVLQGSVDDQERLLAEQIAGLEKDRAFLFPKVPRSLTFRIDLYSHWANEGEHSVHIEETKPLKQVLALATEKFKEINNRSDVQGYWNVYVVLPSGRIVHIPNECWQTPFAKKVFYHDDPPCDARLTTKGGGHYCPECHLHPDMQGLAISWHCPDCDVPLQDLKCVKCNREFQLPPA
ncbi:MAG: hypothetical protein WC791_03070 [Candidatus Paceibacterota bacterium]|jgi:hypothetical protein